MDRRAFLAGAVALLAAPLTVEAQQTGRMYRIGYLGEGMPENDFVLQETLRELGYLVTRRGEISWSRAATPRSSTTGYPISPPS
jgi:hypothetical protein